MILGIAGRIGAGKSTIAQYLVEHRHFTQIGFATALKHEVLDRLPRTLMAYVQEWYSPERKLAEKKLYELIYTERDPVTRALLQEYGTSVRRRDDPDYWTKKWLEAVKAVDRVVTDDVRFVNEAQMVRRSGGLLVKVVSPNQAPLDPETAHESETGLLSWVDWDATFTNDGTIEMLYAQVDAWLTAKLQAKLPLRIKTLLGQE